MAKKAPGKHYRKGISLIELYEMFPNDETAEQWFVSERWHDGLRCAYCNGERVGAKGNHPDNALPLLRLPQVLLGQDRHGDAVQ